MSAEDDLYVDTPWTPERAYEHVLSAVEHNTGGADSELSAAVSADGLRTVCCADGDLAPEMFSRAVDQALENNDLFCYQGSTGGYHFVRREEAALEALIEQLENARHPESAKALLRGLIQTVADADDLDSQRLVGRANQAMQSLKEANDD